MLTTTCWDVRGTVTDAWDVFSLELCRTNKYSRTLSGGFLGITPLVIRLVSSDFSMHEVFSGVESLDRFVLLLSTGSPAHPKYPTYSKYLSLSNSNNRTIFPKEAIYAIQKGAVIDRAGFSHFPVQGHPGFSSPRTVA